MRKTDAERLELQGLEQLVEEQRNEPALAALRKLMEDHFESTKELMVACDPEQLLPLQGTAQAYKKILMYLTKRGE
jgi:DNA-binding transcriptional MocR family regulator